MSPAEFCGYCGDPRPEASVSDDFCSESCQRLWALDRCDFEGEHEIHLPLNPAA